MKKLSLFLIVALLIVVTASSFDYNITQPSETDTPEISVLPQDDEAAARFPAGAKIYTTKCVVCHQVTGEGIPGAVGTIVPTPRLERSYIHRTHALPG